MADAYGTGALPSQTLNELIRTGAICGALSEHVRPSSLDLTLSDEIYRVDRLFLPDAGESVRSLLEKVEATPHNPTLPMECGVTYVARLNETLNLPETVYGFCNPKSTTGRHDIHARVLADGVPRYDDVTPGGWSGELWIAISPKSYPVVAHTGSALSQIRFFTADTRLSERELITTMDSDGLLYTPGGKKLTHSDITAGRPEGSLTLTLDLSGDVAGYECRGTNKIIFLDRLGAYPTNTCFRPVDVHDKTLTLREGRFYILSTREHVRVPPTLACEMRPMDERYGDFRAHYAGFIDPGWGWGEHGESTGRPLTLEVRPFENIEIQHGQIIARIKFERMAAVPDIVYDATGSNYTAQSGPKLAKQFKTE